MRHGGFSIEPWAVFLGRELADVFAVDGWQVLNGTVRFRGNLLVDPELAMHLVTQRVEPFGFVPMMHTPHEIALVRLPAAARRAPQGWRYPLPPHLFLSPIPYPPSPYSGLAALLIMRCCPPRPLQDRHLRAPESVEESAG